MIVIIHQIMDIIKAGSIRWDQQKHNIHSKHITSSFKTTTNQDSTKDENFNYRNI